MSARRWMTALGLVIVTAAPAAARPTYFSVFTSLYGLTNGDRNYACGNCHYLWTGTGGRNPYGQAVEQQLYVGKSITQSIQDIDGVDTDGDGFTNGDEIANYATLPGYSCANFFDAVGAPPDYHTYITPMVASCLDPLDIRISPNTIGFAVAVGDVETRQVTIYNNGSDFPLSITSIGLLPGANPAFSVSSPAVPFDIPVGGTALVDLTFTPVSALLASATLRIASNDPDEPTVDVGVSGIGFFDPVAPPADRASCLKEVDKQMRRYSKAHLKAWNACYRDEVNGIACDAGARDLALGQAEVRFRAAIGGARDRRCAGANLTPGLLDLPDTCGEGCESIALDTMTDFADCLICRQNEAMRDELVAGAGTAPPDLPPNTAGTPQAGRCQKSVLGAMEKGVASVLKHLGRCELANVTALAPVDCQAAVADDLAKTRARVDASFDRCADTTGLLGCRTGMSPDPACLGTAAEAAGASLVDSIYGTD